MILNAVLAGAQLLSGFLGSSKQAKAAKQAAEAERRAQEQALALQREQFAYAKEQNAPYQAIGLAGLNALRDPNANFTASPDYQYRVNQGLGAINENRLARGMFQSGATGKALTQYGQREGSNEFGNWYNRQMGLVGVGQGGVGNAQSAGSQYAVNAGNIYGNMGQIQANRYNTLGNIQANQFGMLSGAAQGAIGSPFANQAQSGLNRYFSKPQTGMNPMTGIGDPYGGTWTGVRYG
jgi:hypothetical protein